MCLSRRVQRRAVCEVGQAGNDAEQSGWNDGVAAEDHVLEEGELLVGGQWGVDERGHDGDGGVAGCAEEECERGSGEELGEAVGPEAEDVAGGGGHGGWW